MALCRCSDGLLYKTNISKTFRSPPSAETLFPWLKMDLMHLLLSPTPSFAHMGAKACFPCTTPGHTSWGPGLWRPLTHTYSTYRGPYRFIWKVLTSTFVFSKNILKNVTAVAWLASRIRQVTFYQNRCCRHENCTHSAPMWACQTYVA